MFWWQKGNKYSRARQKNQNTFISGGFYDDMGVISGVTNVRMWGYEFTNMQISDKIDQSIVLCNVQVVLSVFSFSSFAIPVC